MNFVFVALLVIAVIVLGYVVKMFPFMTYINCVSANVPCTPLQLIAMQLRNVPTDFIIENYVKGRKAGLPLALDRLEVHVLSGGNLANVISGLAPLNGAKNIFTDMSCQSGTAPAITHISLMIRKRF